jgi:hypothetical protein
VIMKNGVFWDIKTQFLPHRRNIITRPSLLKLCKIWGSHGGDYVECRVGLVRTEDYVEHIAAIIRVERISELGTKLSATIKWSTLRRYTSCVLQLLVADNFVPNSLILSTLIMKSIRSSETSVTA